jgi:ribosome recycling factor
MTKIVRREGENGKIAIRNIRRDALGDARDLVKEKEIGKDEEKRAEAEIQILTDRFVGLVEQMVSEKETEVMEV